MPRHFLVIDPANVADPAAVADAVAPHGRVLGVEIRTAQGPAPTDATALVEMADPDEARAAAAAIDGRPLFGRVVRAAMLQAPPPAPEPAASTLYWSPAARAEIESRETRGPRPGDFGDRRG